jgi:hypothetical protein
VGAACIILFATPKTLMGRLLCSQLLVGIGLISYSAYLWHQPLFAFVRLRHIDPVSSSLFILLSAVSLVFAYLSWKYIELPFRDKKNTTKQSIFIMGSLVSALLFSIGLYGYSSDVILIGGSYNNMSTEQKELATYLQYNRHEVMYRQGECFLTPEQSYTDFSPKCKTIIKGKNTLLIWGDSHAAALSTGLRTLFSSLIQYTASGCPPLMDLDFKLRPHCRKINDFILREVERIHPDIVMLHANWFMHQNKILTSAMDRTVKSITRASPSSKIYIVGNVPHWPANLPLFMLKKGIPFTKEIYLYTPMITDLKKWDEKFQLVARDNGVTFFSLIDNLCKGNSCQSVALFDGKLEPTAWDTAHLTAAGSALLANKFFKQWG